MEKPGNKQRIQTAPRLQPGAGSGPRAGQLLQQFPENAQPATRNRE